MTDMDLEVEVALALAAFYDECPDPDCRCVDTLRGLDRAGCPTHDPATPPHASAAAVGGGEQTS